MTAIETDLFDGRCDAYMEGYRLLLRGEQWRRPDGEVFCGEMCVPYKPYAQLQAAQTQYESMNRELENAYREGVNSL